MTFRDRIRAWFEWQRAVEWAESIHPGWVILAIQEKRPNLQEMYRNKILEAYRKERGE